MELYQDQFSAEYDYPHQTQTSKTLVIASTVRSGSHMLGHVLRQTDAFGFPLEYVNKHNLSEWKKRFNRRSLSGVLEDVMAKRTSPNGVFGIKIHYSHIARFGGFSALCEMLPNPHFVLLTREDVMAQAVSLAIARQTGSWISGQSDTRNEPEYRFSDIDDGLRRVCMENASWQYALSASGRRYMQIHFSDVKANTANAVLRIADFMGVAVDTRKIPQVPVTKSQGSELNKQWLTKFQQEFDGDNELLRYNPESMWHKLSKKLS
ncbi:Stf0 family sulfotransferase [Aestuariibacter sp. A3R04]|uniref:Stf0 family sulfotransferase n=1 Tax=Aestuariibacter sp. A3R04 TaxID=2841571 RepID=UPI001C083503|nr:Stf0 family sulfotransferase [Aestuariibacter sp. A3R04]MBU3020864.1 Stf0 sulfotransferase [Aestuariibacter sp. A3R04]